MENIDLPVCCFDIRSENGRITPLLMAAKFGFAEIVKYLVKTAFRYISGKRDNFAFVLLRPLREARTCPRSTLRARTDSTRPPSSTPTGETTTRFSRYCKQ